MGRAAARGRSRNKRGLAVERLEFRAMLAGNVTVNLSGNNLVIRGDNADNQIAIVQLGAGQYAVLGLNDTEVNGDTDPVFRSGITGNIDVDLKRGNNVLGVGNDVEGLVGIAQDLGVEVDESDVLLALELLDEANAPEDFSAPKHLNVRTGDGHDAVGIIGNIGLRINADLGGGDNALAIRTSNVGDDIIVRSGSGDDVVEVAETDIDQMLDVNLGNGNNRLLVFGTEAGESAIVHTGSGRDVVVFDGSEIDDNLIVRTGNGNDSVYLEDYEFEGMFVGKNVDIDTGSGHDYFALSSDVGGDLKVKTGSGNDEGGIYQSDIGRDLILETGDGHDGDSEGLFLEDLFVGRNLRAILGSGNDALFALGNVNVNRDALVDAGSGHDLVSIEESAVNGLFTALMGSGNDFLRICDSVAPKAKADGGSGNDELQSDFDPEDLPSGYSVKNFEEFSECDEEEEEDEEPV